MPRPTAPVPRASASLLLVSLTVLSLSPASLMAAEPPIDPPPLPPPGSGPAFIRGDVNVSGEVDFADLVVLYTWFFRGGAAPVCRKAADLDDDGLTDMQDYSYIVSFLFQAGSAPPAPFPVCGQDPTFDSVSCLEPCIPPAPPVSPLLFAPNAATPGSFVRLRVTGTGDPDLPWTVLCNEQLTLVVNSEDLSSSLSELTILVPKLPPGPTSVSVRRGDVLGAGELLILPSRSLRLVLHMDDSGIELLQTQPTGGGFFEGTAEGGRRLSYDVFSGEGFVYTAEMNHPTEGRMEVFGSDDTPERITPPPTAVFALKVPNVPELRVRFYSVDQAIDVRDHEGRAQRVFISEVEIP